MARIDEIAPDLYRICVYVPRLDMQFNHFLVRDEEPLLFHAGLKAMFPELRKAMATLPDGSTKWLIYIKDWDFRWQHVYRYVTPFALPKGTNRPRAGVSVARISTRPQRRCARALTAIVTVAVTTLRWNL